MKETEMVKVVIKENDRDSDTLLAWIRNSVTTNKGYLIELVIAEHNPGFISSENITVFPTIYVDFSTRRIEGLQDSLLYFKDNYL